MGSNSSIENKLAALIKENEQLKKQLNNKNKNANDQQHTINKSQPNLIKDAQHLTKVGYWNYNFKEDIFNGTDDVYALLELPIHQEHFNREEIFAAFHPSELAIFKKISQEFRSTKKDYEFTLRVKVFDGSAKFIAVNAAIEHNDRMEPVRFYGTCIDISEFRYKTEKLSENEKLFRSLFNNITDVFIIFEPQRNRNGEIIDFIYKDVNPIFEMKFNKQRNEIINHSLSEQPNLYQQFHKLLSITSITREPHQDSFFVPDIDNFVDILIYSPSEGSVATIWRDISLMIETNSSLKESEEKYRQMFSIGKDGLVLFDQVTGKIIESNPAAANMFGYSRELLAQKTIYELLSEKEEFSSIIHKKGTQANHRGLRNNGNEFPIESSLSYFNWNGHKVAISSMRDISEREVTQKQLIKSENRFKQLFDYSNDAILIIQDYAIVKYNRKALDLFNTNENPEQNKNLWDFSPNLQPNGQNSKSKFLEYLQQAMNGSQLHFEWIFQRNVVETYVADVKLSPIITQNEKIVQVIIRDISQQKEYEEKLINKEIRWKSSLEISTTGVWDWDIVTNEVYYSDVWKQIIGYNADEISNRFEEFSNRIHPEDVEQLYAAIENYLAGKTDNFSEIFRMRCKNGTFKYIQSNGNIYSYTSNGKPKQFVGTHIDITKHVIKQQELAKENQDLKSITKKVKLGTWELDLKNMVFNASQQTLEILGFDTDSILNIKMLENSIHPEDQDKFIKQFISRTNHDTNLTFRIITNNSVKIIASYSSPILNNNNILVGYSGTFQDISQYKQNEQSEAKLNQIGTHYIEKTNQTVILIQDEVVSYANDKIKQVTGFNYDEFTTEHASFISIVVPEDKAIVKNQISKILEGHTLRPITIRIETKHKKIKWVNLNVQASNILETKSLLLILTDISNERAIEEKLKISDDRLEYIKVNSPIGACFFDPKYNIFFINPELEKVLGFNFKANRNVSLQDIFSKKDYQTIIPQIERIGSKEKAEFILEVRLKNDVWVVIKIIPGFSTESDITHYILFVENIDVAKNQINLLSEENLLLSKIAEKADIGIAVFDSNQDILFFNQNLLKVFNLDFSLSILRNFNDLNIDIQKHKTSFDEILKSDKDVTIVLKHGDRKINIAFNPLALNGNKVMFIKGRDITEQTNQQKYLLGQLDRFKSIFESAPLGISLLDKNRNIVIANKKYASTLCENEANLYEKRLDQIIHTESLPQLVNNFAELLTQTKSSFSQRLKVSDKHGNLKWLNTFNTIQIDQYNDVKFIIQIVLDISDNVQEEIVNLENQKLETLRIIADTFANGFNNQLMAMYGNAYLLKNNIGNAVMQKQASDLFNSISSASEMTNNLLSLSKSSRNVTTLVNVPKLLKTVIDRTNKNNNISFDASYHNNEEYILGDSSKLQNVFTNIITNAIESISDEGQINIETQTTYFEDDLTSRGKTIKKGKYLRVSITDTGSGIKRSNHHNIYTPFFTTKTKQLNAGLGLTVALKTVHEHKGNIQHTSNNNGTTFLVYLPIPEEEALKNTIQPDEQFIIKGSANLIIVDDEDVVRIVTSELLKRLGYNVYSFSKGKTAIQFYKLNNENIDLIILDKQMPEMDGFEVYKHLKEINPGVKTILLSGLNVADEFIELFGTKNNAVIQKPVSIENLSLAISKVLKPNY